MPPNWRSSSRRHWQVGPSQTVSPRVCLPMGLTPILSSKKDPAQFHSLPPHKGRAQLMRILETLARVKPHETSSLATLLSRVRADLSWGTTVILITGIADQPLFDEIIHTRRGRAQPGINPVWPLCQCPISPLLCSSGKNPRFRNPKRRRFKNLAKIKKWKNRSWIRRLTEAKEHRFGYVTSSSF